MTLGPKVSDKGGFLEIHIRTVRKILKFTKYGTFVEFDEPVGDFLAIVLQSLLMTRVWKISNKQNFLESLKYPKCEIR